MFYRVCIIDDFKNETSVIDCKKFGTLKVFDAWKISSEHRGYQTSEDDIGLFVNYELIYRTKNKEAFRRKVLEVLKQTPKEFKEEIEELKHYLEI